jgi:hypothetical protein
VTLYGEKITPPTHRERLQATRPRRCSFPPGKGPNHRRSTRRNLQRSALLYLARPSFAPQRKRGTLGWLKLLNRLYIHPTVDIPSTDTKTKIEETDNDGIDQDLTVSNNENILDETDDELEEYDARDDDIKSKGDENDANDNEWMPDDSNDSITAPITLPPTTNKKKRHSTTRQLDISSFTTQNAHGLRRRPCNTDGNIMPHGPHDYTRYEHLITSMKTKNLDVYFVQETLLEDDVFDKVINGYHVFRHNGKLGNRNFCGVVIILSPRYYEGWKAAGATPPTTTDATGEFSGRYISVTVKLDSNDK